MQASARMAMGALSVMLVSGCRTATRVIEEPRVDLEMPEGANRGYLVGTPPPPAAGRKTTRQMVETEIEVPPLGIAQPQQPEAVSPEAAAKPPRAAPVQEPARATKAPFTK